MSELSVNGESPSFSYQENYNQLVQQPGVGEMLEASMRKPPIAVELFAALTDRVSAGAGDKREALRLRGDLETAFRRPGAELQLAHANELPPYVQDKIAASAKTPREAWMAYDAQNVDLGDNPRYYWDTVLSKVGQGECTASELQLVLDSMHPSRQQFAIVKPPTRYKSLAAQTKIEGVLHLPGALALARVQKAIIDYAQTQFPYSQRMAMLHNAYMAAEAKLRELRGDVGDELLDPYDEARDQRLLGASKLLPYHPERFPKTVRETFDECQRRQVDRERLRRYERTQARNGQTPSLTRAVFKAVFTPFTPKK